MWPTLIVGDRFQAGQENRRGIEPASLAAALREMFDRVETEIQDDEAEGAAA